MKDAFLKETGTLVLECHVRAEPRQVFADFTIPDRLLQWWGDRSKWWLTSAEVDLRTGGRFWVLWQNTDGKMDGMGGHFKVIDPPQSFTLSFIGSHAKDHIDEVTIRLQPENAGTKVVLRHSGLAGRPRHYTNYQQGWNLILSWLARQY